MKTRLSKRDWLDHGLKVLASEGFTALKAHRLVESLGVSRGSFYWHFADSAAFKRALLEHWRHLKLEAVIETVEATPDPAERLATLMRLTAGAERSLERAVRAWVASDEAAREFVTEVDEQRIRYATDLLMAASVPEVTARHRARFIYWAYLGHAFLEGPEDKASVEALASNIDWIVLPSDRLERQP